MITKSGQICPPISIPFLSYDGESIIIVYNINDLFNMISWHLKTIEQAMLKGSQIKSEMHECIDHHMNLVIEYLEEAENA